MICELFERHELRRFARHAASILTLFAMTGCALSAQSQREPPQRVTERVSRNTNEQRPNTGSEQQTPEPPHVINVTLPPPDPKQQAEERANRQSEIAIQKSLDNSTRALVIIGVLQVVGLVVSLGIANKNANAALLSAHAASDSASTLKIQQRAWVGVDRLKNTKFVIGEPAIITAYVKNTGATPARHLACLIGMQSARQDEPEPARPDYAITQDREPSIGFIQPGATMEMNCPSPIPLTQEMADLLQAGEVRIYIWMHMTYADVFGASHYTDFRARWERGTFTITNLGNNAD